MCRVRCISSLSRARATRASTTPRGMQPLAIALAAGDSDGMSERDAVQLCTTLRSMASTICDSLTKRLQSQLGEPGGGDRSLDKSGEQVQGRYRQRGHVARLRDMGRYGQIWGDIGSEGM